MLLVDAQRLGSPMERAEWLGAGEEVDVHPRDAVGAELDVAGAGAGVAGRLLFVAEERDDVGRNSAGRGRNWEARRLIARAEGVAASSWLSPHLLIRLRGLAVRAAASAALSAFEEAASRYAALGRPMDEARCRAHMP
jgi:hypothetical protein